MRFRDGIFLSLLVCSFSVAHGQTSGTDQTLPAVTVRGTTPERFSVGQKTQRIDSVTLEQFRFQNLTDVLTYTTPIAFKIYGSGQLATSSFRGTSSNHTAVLWNGININQPTLGQTDFSTLPVAGFDQLAVQYGSSASCVGSDAVGGSILLMSNPKWQQPGLLVSAGQKLASFRNFATQGGVRFVSPAGKTWQIAGKTFFYTTNSNNDFPYRERGNYFVERSITKQKGFIQDLYFRNQKNQQLSVNFWLTDNDLTVTPFDTTVRERTRSQSYRFLTTYETSTLTLRLGWIRDIIDYARGNFTNPSHSQTDRLISRIENEFKYQLKTSQVSLRIGGEWSHYNTQVDGYGDQLIQEDRADLFALARLDLNRWLLSANIRQAFVTRFDPPVTPTVGAEYLILKTATSNLTAKGSVARSYRVPTLNERYWKVLGNPNIRPENGFNLEAGLSERWLPNERFSISTEATVFRNRIDDWSYWNPEYGYRVENLQLVVARGLEWNGVLNYTTPRWQSGLTLGYALTRSSQERVYNVYAQDIIGKQLVYVPKHSRRFSAYVAHGKNRFTILNQINSRQYITFDNIQFLRGFMLTNLLLETQIKLGSIETRIQGQVTNLFNTVYFNVKRNAMPGRSFSVQLICNLNTTKQ
ncbi:TonB-dependent receptor plug domain-containing protein [Larkinella terrae]|uniref:TonB-dependent receptor plug domain-containing protein n=1 Tax=Larkinella terrae TaxID=2025311 RepID=A0A7K0ELG6_9BACT|nr:TonB-dependent receptor plug domain-containing protein [Larkinella terrae]MRS62700.1 TonB-dependent receptor plug domain-containing protein [Larkinella terrae]